MHPVYRFIGSIGCIGASPFRVPLLLEGSLLLGDDVDQSLAS
ncbi:hypothetical protein ACE3MQ_05640 [Paenibacillus lentus]